MKTTLSIYSNDGKTFLSRYTYSSVASAKAAATHKTSVMGSYVIETPSRKIFSKNATAFLMEMFA